MAEALQHHSAALFARIPTACAPDNEPVPDAARSGRANAIVSPARWYRKAVRPIAGLPMQIPYSTEQGIISAEQGILAQEQGILSGKIEIIDR